MKVRTAFRHLNAKSFSVDFFDSARLAQQAEECAFNGQLMDGNNLRRRLGRRSGLPKDNVFCDASEIRKENTVKVAKLHLGGRSFFQTLNHAVTRERPFGRKQYDKGADADREGQQYPAENPQLSCWLGRGFRR